jgi:hypothetical protein
MYTSLICGATHEIDKDSNFLACERICLILEKHQPEPLGKAKQDKLNRILTVGNQGIRGKNE